MVSLPLTMTVLTPAAQPVLSDSNHERYDELRNLFQYHTEFL